MAEVMAPRQHARHEGIVMYVPVYVCIPGPARARQELSQRLAFNLGTDKLVLENTSGF